MTAITNLIAVFHIKQLFKDTKNILCLVLEKICRCYLEFVHMQKYRDILTTYISEKYRTDMDSTVYENMMKIRYRSQ